VPSQNDQRALGFVADVFEHFLRRIVIGSIRRSLPQPESRLRRIEELRRIGVRRPREEELRGRIGVRH
jgi:hypothetical protein